MPVVNTLNDNDDVVQIYRSPMRVGYLNWSGAGEIKLRAIRADAARTIAEFASVKDTRRYFQKIEKAATIVLNWFNAPIGPNEIKGWPIELACELDYAFNTYDLA